MTELWRSSLVWGTVLAFFLIGCTDPPGPGPCQPIPEECNARDDDCDGEIDESDSGGPLRRDCSNACGAGLEECYLGVWDFCTAPAVLPESCNGSDDNCDGQIDEGCVCEHGESEACGEAVGVCERGVRHCQSGTWGACQFPYDPDTLVELCNDGLDNDCDGHIDEECTCLSGATQPCGREGGECVQGEQTCGEDSQWIEECVGEVGPEPDICDGLDNNCDGETDYVVSLDFGWRGDRHEINNTCGDASPLYNDAREIFVAEPLEGEDAEVVSPSVGDSSDLNTYPTLYPPGDEDWYYTQTREETDCWVPFMSDCAFRLGVQLWLADRDLVDGAEQNPEDWRLCVTLGGCMDGTTYCTHMDDWFESSSLFQLTLVWGNGCNSSDPTDVKIQVHSPTEAACGHYQVYTWFEYDDTLECPD